MKYLRPVRIEKRNEETEQWETYMEPVHAKINKNTRKTGYETLDAGAIQFKRTLTFEVRYSKPIQEIAFNTQMYRIIYQGQPYDIVDYDDYMERHISVKLTGVIY